jgi:hypothetical protein
LHAAVSLDRYEYEAAAMRYRREFSEMVVSGGKIRTGGGPQEYIQTDGFNSIDLSDKGQSGASVADLESTVTASVAAAIESQVDDRDHRGQKSG